MVAKPLILLQLLFLVTVKSLITSTSQNLQKVRKRLFSSTH
ncbi:Uncharacterised protein [Vibrio cholerae]|nr:Uncharacterised protein [Vibrio cholerae]